MYSFPYICMLLYILYHLDKVFPLTNKPILLKVKNIRKVNTMIIVTREVPIPRYPNDRGSPVYILK